ncbi:NAD(P)-dependent oxidoreductase [Microbacterium sp. VKM Ac-2870]|uniref:NAD-dependent epimerase/dehydratase family protein n=1 Tax=Microbacterium sp. VKM Ac-2870 TaxID=2783825 RepID=UPI00188D3D8E|nr:NAD(P)-dependent oxidoreductase [Microbacterium sp. VKM Ac-2870]MBF4561666.1 NAD(P)-dependent oxidoreductase [Microbacterium sp. VKM Ac-2870]
MKVAVTGATGFLGRGLVRTLRARGWEVDVLVRDGTTEVVSELTAIGAGVRIVDGPAGASAAVEASGADAVAHLATHYLRTHAPTDIGPLIRANVEFGTGVLDAAAELSVPVVTASSFFQFSQGQAQPSSLYAATKQAFSTIASYYRRERAVDVREVVLYDTYGPGDTRDKLIPLLVGAALSGDEVRLGVKDQPLNLTYLDDVTDALAILLSAPSPALTTIRTESVHTVGEIVDAIGKLAGRRLGVRYADGTTVNDRPLTAGDWPTPPGWVPQVSLVDGLARTLAASRMTGGA